MVPAVIAAGAAVGVVAGPLFLALPRTGGSGFVGSSLPQLARRPVSAEWASSPCQLRATATNRGPEELVEGARRLLTEISETVLGTGFEVGLRRAAKGAQATAQTVAEILREPPTSVDDAFIARSLRLLFEKLGATYVKLGQFIASSPTVFPPDYVREFQQCLDSTNTVPFEEVKRIVEEELGAPLLSVFTSFDEEPLASASIAQVHTATLRSGEDVVVKVQKPGIEDVLRTDLGFVYITARVLEFINPDLNIRGSLADIAEDLRTSMLGELDFREEAQNLDTFRSFLAVNNLTGQAVAPRPFRGATSRRVLTMERLRGVPLIDLEGIKRYAANPEATLVAALNVWVLSVQACEFFHADVHAGNLLVLEDGRVGFIDFGIVGRIPPAMSAAIDDLNAALATGDARGMARALISMGATVGNVDEEKFATDIAKLLDRFGSDDAESAGTVAVDEAQIQDIVLDIAQVAGENGLKLPREFGLLIKQSLYFDRYTRLLAPELDMMSDDRIARFSQQGVGRAAEAEAGEPPLDVPAVAAAVP